GRRGAPAPARAGPALRPRDAPATGAPGQGRKVRVALDPAFAERARLDGEAAVFVLARVPGGPPMPVAVERHRVRDLPLEVVLDDRDSPMPTQKLSTMDQVEVLARISAAGSANRGEGDVESAPVRVRLPAEGTVELTLGAPAPSACAMDGPALRRPAGAAVDRFSRHRRHPRRDDAVTLRRLCRHPITSSSPPAAASMRCRRRSP